VRDRLKQKYLGFGYDFQVLLTHYALERLLYRLGRSRYRGRFLLKGALLFNVWYDQPVRSSMDADLLDEGPGDIPKMEKIFRDLCRLSVEPDGLEFLADTVHGEEIRENSEYQGIRVILAALLAGARIHLQVDIGFGDAVIPPAKTIKYPALLDYPAPSVKAYTHYTVIAEKFQTIVDKGLANSRMKDYYDIWYISRHSDIDGVTLAKSIAATFKRRKAELPKTIPEGLNKGFSSDHSKQRQWASFLKKHKPRETRELPAVVDEIHNFLMPVVISLIDQKQYAKVWRPGQGWNI
jgi:predicted nucleotidyltransferase component of viral defense system